MKNPTDCYFILDLQLCQSYTFIWPSWVESRDHMVILKMSFPCGVLINQFFLLYFHSE